MSEGDQKGFNLFKEYEKVMNEIKQKLGELVGQKKIIEKELVSLRNKNI